MFPLQGSLRTLYSVTVAASVLFLPVSPFAALPTFARPPVSPSQHPLHPSSSSSFRFIVAAAAYDDEDGLNAENELISESEFDYFGDTGKFGEDGSIASSTLGDISFDYNFPLDYIARAVCSWGATPPINSDSRLGDLVNSEQCYALLEAVTTLDPSAVDDAFSDDTIVDLANDWGVDVGVVFEACLTEGVEMPFGVRSRITLEEVEEVRRWCMTS